ncbi:Acetylornithine deacetylase/Succinyl-diaminopimelate desuccinylase [Granulicella rosea]|uniref:Acetylornithine deacetylase/Succinyl-diaminopimelate desuccinylase n=1 Tax=Granulicella rosea TaxID=474952 RepID=A0A239HTD4_9BACT|nr:M20/M25/M40 family metallo-hydrolase [Granulicella rosea]SNS84637.1 Acetylornithine deacetylase/Succinyl-diaminopimelate desuccinylase [Granulicella rosea]
MRFSSFARLAAAVCLTPAVVVLAQGKTAAQLLADPAVQAAMQSVEARQPHFIEEQIRLTEIPAPPFHESVRGAELKRLFTEAGLQNVRTDAVGNILGDRPGMQPHPHLVIAAHLDTVFPEGTDVRVKRNGNVLTAPGIGDDGTGLASLLALIDAMQRGKLQTNGTVTFVADVGEEGLGDSRGAKELFNTTLKGQIDKFISIDGDDPVHIVNTGVGSFRYRVTFTGPGGHSYGAFGLANPIHALSRAIAHVADIDVPTTPKTTYSTGRIGGGTSVNSIPFEAWFEFDERSSDPKALDAVDRKFKAAVQQGLDEENAFRHDKGKLSVKLESIGVRPAGETPADSAIVAQVKSSIEALKLGTPRLEASSTDSNVPMHLGIPAVTLGGGGSGKGAHSLGESYDSTDAYKGVQNLLLITLLLAQ